MTYSFPAFGGDSAYVFLNFRDDPILNFVDEHGWSERIGHFYLSPMGETIGIRGYGGFELKSALKIRQEIPTTRRMPAQPTVRLIGTRAEIDSFLLWNTTTLNGFDAERN